MKETTISALLFILSLIAVAVGGSILAFGEGHMELSVGTGWLIVFAIWFGVPGIFTGAFWWILAMRRRKR